MKKIYLLSFLAVSCFGLLSFGTYEKEANIRFDETVHDFGTIQEGERPVYNFQFTNTGDAALVITSVNKSCGCTEPEFSKEPVLPGKTSEIKVGYNSTNRSGRFDKTITVNSNAKDGAVSLRIVGNVVKADK